MRRLTLALALLLTLAIVAATRPAVAASPPVYTANLARDILLDPGARVTALVLDLAPGPYLVSGQLLVGAADSGTTCTAAITTDYAGEAYAQASTHEPGELAPLPVTFAPFLTSTEHVRLVVACTVASKIKAFPNTLRPTFEDIGEPQPRSASWLIAVPLGGK